MNNNNKIEENIFSGIELLNNEKFDLVTIMALRWKMTNDKKYEPYREKWGLELTENIKNNIPKLISYINKQNLNEYIKMVVNFSFEANKYFNDSEPWSLKTKDPQRMNAILHTILEQIKNISILLNPIIPISTKKVLDTINLSDKDISIDNIKKDDIFNYNLELKNLDILFKKIENDN